MTATSMSRMAVPYVVLAAACGVALVFAIQYSHRAPPVEAKAASAAQAASTPASGPRDHRVRRRSQRRKPRQMQWSAA